MTLKQHTCITLACNVCGDPFTDEDEGGTPHFDTVQEARDFQDAWDDEYHWTILDDGYALCPDDDESHASVRESLKPQAPAAQVPGQQEIPAEAEPVSFASPEGWDDAWSRQQRAEADDPANWAHGAPVHAEELDEHGRGTGNARCDTGDGTFVDGPIADSSWQVTCEKCLNDEADLPGFRGAGDCEPCQGTGLNIGLPGNCPACGGTGNAK